jgi:hypothetical protein
MSAHDARNAAPGRTDSCIPNTAKNRSYAVQIFRDHSTGQFIAKDARRAC